MTKGKWKSPMQQALVEWLTTHPDVSRNELARRAGIDKASVVKIANGEKDNLNGDSAIALSAAMGLSVEDLYAGRARPAAAPASAPIDATTDVRGTLRMLSLSALTINPLNPRKAFDDEHLAELAESIAAEGVLQNLVVAPAARDGRHIVIAGGRRQRAIMKLVEQGRWAEDAPTIPCRILAGAEPRVRALALIENLQRVDLKPMEEAEAFAELQQLDAKLWTTAHIAETVHRTARFVQQRLGMATKLTARAKAALADGTINVEMARELVKAPMKRQVQLLGEIERRRKDGWRELNAAGLRQQITEKWMPWDAASFDRTLYTGEIVTDDDTGEKWFTDAGQFQKLQLEAAKAKRAELDKQRAWAELKNVHQNQFFHEYEYNTSRAKDLQHTGVIVVIDRNWQIQVHDGLMRKPSEAERVKAKVKAAAKGKNGKGLAIEKPEPPPFTARLLMHVRQTKTEWLQDAIARRSVADQGDTAMCLAIIGLLEVNTSRVRLSESMRLATEGIQGSAVAQRLRVVFGEIATLAPPKRGRGYDAEADEIEFVDDPAPAKSANGGDPITPIHAHRIDPPDFQGATVDQRVWDWLRLKTRDERIEIFSLLVADRCGFFDFHNNPPAEHTPFDVALVAHVGLNTTQLWRPDREWLDASRKARLEALARGIRLDPIPKSTTQLRDAIAARFAAAEQPGGEPLPPAEDWIPPEIMVLEKAALEQRLKPAANAVRPVTAVTARKAKAQREGAPA